LPSSIARCYGLARVARVWKVSRAGVYRFLTETQPNTSARRGPVGACSDAELADHIRQQIAASRLHGEGYRKLTLQETNRQWFDRAQAEANLASEFASKLTAARSIPEAMATCQEWTSRRFEMMAEDGKHLFADTQKFMEAAARLVPTGSLIAGAAGTST